MKYHCVLLNESGEIVREIPRESTVGGLIRELERSPENVDTIGFVIMEDNNEVRYESQFSKCDIIGRDIK